MFTLLSVDKKENMLLEAFIDKMRSLLNHNNFNVHILYHSIYFTVSSIKTYDLMMA
jgi:hypothetical protein